MSAVVEPREPLVTGSKGECASAPNVFQLVLPEPAPSRAEAVPAGLAGQWLRDVVAADRHGYAMLSGPGWTTVALYNDGSLITVCRIRGNDALTRDAEAAFHALHAPDVGEAFAVAHQLRPEIAVAVSGLFAAPVWLMMTAPEKALSDILERLRVATFLGAIHVGFDSDLWAIVLFDDGDPIASHGSDDRRLKRDLADLTPMHAFDALSVSVHPQLEHDLHSAFGHPEIEASSLSGADSRDLITVESRLIEALSALEYGLETACGPTEERREGITVALAAACQHLANAQVVTGAANHEDAPSHPLIGSYRSEAQHQIDTGRLLDALRTAPIPDAWRIAIHALVEATGCRVRLPGRTT